MLEDTNVSDDLVRPLPITMPGPTVPAAGDWRGRGLCVGENPDAFFPSRNDPGSAARKVCAACTVKDDCLGYALDADEFGIWGGLDQIERRNLKRRQHRKKTAARRKTAQRAGAA